MWKPLKGTDGEAHGFWVRQARIQTNPFPEQGVVVRTCNPSTEQAEAEGQQVRGQAGLHKTLSQKTNQPAWRWWLTPVI
jgi:hypothetical protein